MITAIVILSIVVFVLIMVIVFLWNTVDELQDNLIETHETVCKVNGELHSLLDLDIHTLNSSDHPVYRSRYAIEKRSPYDKTPEFVRGIKEMLDEQYRILDRIQTVRYYETWNKNDSDKKEETNNAAE